MSLSFPVPTLGDRCILVSDFLSAAECAELIASSEHDGYASAATDYPPSYRNNHRHVIDSVALAERLDDRLRAHAPPRLVADNRDWHVDGINARFRFCRYAAGERFAIHQDGVHYRGPDCRSHLTLLIYLTDGMAFTGGDTVFYAQGPAGAQSELGRVRPQAGSLLLFDHAIWHAGAEVESGIKHVLRSDVLYRAAPMQTSPADNTAHQGYVWTLARLDADTMASGGRDAVIRIWNSAGHAVRQLHGHTQSVLGLAPLPGQRLASVSRDRTLRLWNWSTGMCEATIAAHDTAVLDVLSLPGGQLATSGADGLIKLWRQDGTAVGTLAGHDGWVWQMAPWRNGHLASASEDGTVRIWDTASMRCTATLPGAQPLRTLLVVHGAIWTGDVFGRIACWTFKAGTWTLAAQFQAHDAAIRRLRAINANRVASASEDYTLRVWDTTTRTQTFAARHDNFVTDVLDGGNTIVSSSYDGRIIRHEEEEVTS